MALGLYKRRLYGVVQMEIKQTSLFGNVEDTDTEYQKFVDKFKPKKTTDDCYTPPNIYEAVKDYVIDKYNLQGLKVLRPFYPGGNYEAEEYPEDCVVIDNPPFSILSKIYDFYLKRNIRFFLFASTLTLFGNYRESLNYLPIDITLTYENGAKVNTSFATNLGEYKIDCDAKLYHLVLTEDLKNKNVKVLPKYVYPEYIIKSTSMARLLKQGISFKLKNEDVFFIRELDCQKNNGIFGGGFLISEKAALKKAALKKAEADNAVHFELSAREKDIIKHLGG